MKFRQSKLQVKTQESSIQIITRAIEDACLFLEEFEQGLLQVFLRHTSASLSINENADNDVRKDLIMALDRIVPRTFLINIPTKAKMTCLRM